jgi:tetratricopeptide (TPR) repeat protein
MTTRTTRLAFASFAILLAFANVASAQRGRGGMVGNRGGGGANFSRPANVGQNFSRPANVGQSFNRPTNVQQNFNRPTNVNQNFNRPTNVNQNFNRPTNINQNINRPTNLNQNNFNRTNLNQSNINNNRTVVNNNINVNNINRTQVNNVGNRGNYAGYGVGYGGYGNRGWGGNGFYGSGYHGNSYYGYHSNWVNGSMGGYAPGWGRYGGYGGYGGYGYGNSGYGIGAAALGIGAGVGVAAWGLGSLLNNYGYSQYSNPYYTTAYVSAPANFSTQAIGYDYSRPLDLVSSPPDETVIQSSETSFDSAREAFLAGDYNRALTLADQSLKQTPNDPMLHEFRATCLFALRRYDEAAVPFYTVLSAGPGWDWTTLIGLYPNVETYTAQLRALEAFCNGTPQAASARFVLAALYLTQGSKEAAAVRLKEIVALQPQDRLSAQLLQAITTSAQPAQVAAQGQPSQPLAAPLNDTPPANPTPVQGAASTPAEAPALPSGPVPANLVGAWTASPAPEVTITLTVIDDKTFGWKVVEKGQTREFKGDATFDKDKEVIALIAAEMPPMVAKVSFKDPAHFNFKAVGTPSDDPGLDFGK